jgi:sulfite reductase (NADPH) flavoprotein alpha-component
MRRIHEGRHDGPIWQMVVLFAGLSPPLLFVTGIMMWLRRRRYAAAMAAQRSELAPASISSQALDQDQFAA